MLHGAYSYLLQDAEGQIASTHSISAGLDYPGVGPQHSYLKDAGLARYDSATDAEALAGFQALAALEGILPALEPAHAIGWLLRRPLPEGSTVLVCLSGRGDKDLDTVRQKGFVQAGVNGGVFGFGMPDEKGVWRGLDVDTARAVAAAVFGDAEKVKFVPLTAQQRFTALQSGEIDLLTRNATRTLSRDTQLGLNFVTVNYYDGQGFMIAKKASTKT